MSSVIYNKAFEAELTHDYYVYTDAPLNNQFSVNRNIAIVPTKECEALMKRGRMRFVRTAKGFTLFYQAYIDGDGNQQPFVKLSDDTEFTFALYIDANAVGLFYNVSDLNAAPKTYSAEKLYMLSQTINDVTPPPPVTAALTPSLANSLRSPVFSYGFQPSPSYTGGADVVIFSGATEVLVIEGVAYNAVTKSYTAEVDLRAQPKGFYSLKAYKAGMAHISANEINTNDFYVDGDLAGKNTFGIMTIKYATIDRLYDTTTLAASFTTFGYNFNARAVTWRYYIVAENLDETFFDSWDLTVVKTGGPVFNASYYPPDPPFTQPLAQPDATVPVRGLRTVVLQSASPIAFSEDPRKGFDLYKHPVAIGSDVRIVSNLPNASSVGVDSDQWSPAQTPPLPPVSGISEIYVFI
jgi:hypothetical protein